METNKTVKYAHGCHPNTLSSLAASRGHIIKSPERRKVHASARLTKSVKENLTVMLSDMNLTLGDFLEKIVLKEILIVRNK
jgi:hypothetical protein